MLLSCSCWTCVAKRKLDMVATPAHDCWYHFLLRMEFVHNFTVGRQAKECCQPEHRFNYRFFFVTAMCRFTAHLVVM